MRHSFFILAALFGMLTASAAVPDSVSGKVVDGESGEALAGVIVKSGKAFATTDMEGRFTLGLRADADSVTFRCLGYETGTLPAGADFSEVRLARKTTQLRDVVVEAPDIYARGDTLVFNVSRYAREKDNAIIDVIKRLPGISVEKDGTIKYQGKPINKFYLDGNDFLGGQYGLATENISHKDVKSVEVLENHQPVQALEGIEFPEEAGINLKLKDDARSRWVGVAAAGTGAQPLLYDGSVFAMRMAPKIQNLFTLKANNTGRNPADEILDHDLDDMSFSDYSESLWPRYITADITGSPLPEKRTRDNQSWLADAITAWKSGDTSMRIKFDYTGDVLDYSTSLTTDYFSDNIPKFVQHNALRTRSHALSAGFYAVTNKRGHFLRDRFTLRGSADKASSAVTGSSILKQSVDRKEFSAANDLKLIKRNEKRLFTLISRNTFSHNPDLLLVYGTEDARQSVGATDFRSTTETSLGKLTRFWKYYLSAGLDLDWHHMNSTLAGLGEYDNSSGSDAFLSKLYVSPRADFERGGWRLSLSVPLKWKHYSVSGQHDYIDAGAHLGARKQLSAKSELSAAASYRHGAPQAYLFNEVTVLTDYRNLFITGSPGKSVGETSGSISYRYRNPMKALFFNLSTDYTASRNSLMTNQLFVGDLIVSTYADRYSACSTWRFSGGISKGFGHSRMVGGLEAEASASSAKSMRENEVVPYRQTAVRIKPYLKGSILTWLSINYEADFGFSLLSLTGTGSCVHTFSQNLFATIIPCERVQFTAGGEQFLSRVSEGHTANLILLDASAVWHMSSRFRLTVSATNILNRRNYQYTTYGTLSLTEHIYRLRPRNILATVQYRF